MLGYLGPLYEEAHVQHDWINNMDTESSVGIFRALDTCKSSSLKNANELYNSFNSFFEDYLVWLYFPYVINIIIKFIYV